MKTLFFKNRMPIAIAVLAIAGAFATTSMQTAPKNFALKIGYVLQQDGECVIPVGCSDIPGPVCRLSYPVGQPAFDIDPILGHCTTVLYRRQ